MPADLNAPPAPAIAPPTPAVPTAAPAKFRVPSKPERQPWRSAPPRRTHRRGMHLALGGALLSAFISGFIWLGSLFAPPHGVDFVMIGAGYEENLAVPHNVFGWNTLLDLATAVDHGSQKTVWSRRFWRDSPQAERLNIDSDFAKLIPATTTRQMVIYVSAHGGVDLSGAYFVADDDKTPVSPAHRIRLTTLIDRLAALPAEQQKVVVLDAVLQPSDVARGMLTNTFAYEVSKLEERIAKIPNLVVICSSGQDQLAWPCPEWTRTVYGHFWIEGLRGAATDDDDDGRIDLAELHAFASEQTQHWSQRRFGVRQTPWMLPSGAEGQRRAERMDVAWKENPYQPSTPSRELPASVPKAVREAWNTAAALNARSVPPYVYQSQTWRRYVATIGRYEQLALAGDSASAERLAAQAQALATTCGHDPTQLLLSLESQRCAANTDAKNARLHGAAQDLLQQFAQSPANQWGEVWKQAFASAGENGPALRAEVLQLLLDQAIGDPTRRLEPVQRLIEIVHDPAQPLRPALQFAVMLEHDLPPESRTLAAAPLISQTLRIRHLAEQATTGDINGFTPSSPRVRAWVSKQIAAADALRQEAEDLVLAGPEHTTQATARLTSAEKMYREAIINGEGVLAAYRARDRAFALLPDLTMSLVSAPRTGNHRITDLALFESRIEQAWQRVHELTRDLAAPDDLSSATLSDLREHTQSVEEHLTSINQQARSLWRELAHDRHSIASLRLPHMPLPTADDIELRCSVSDQSLQLLREQRENLRQVLTMVASGHDAEPPASAGKAPVQALAAVRARLALAMLGERRFTELAQPGDDTWVEVQHRLEIVRVDADWRESLAALGNQLANRWQRMPGAIDDMLAKCNPDGLPSASCVEADNLARQIPVQWYVHLEDKASEALRRRRLSAFLAWQAERAWSDHWSGKHDELAPYYSTRARALLADAERVWPHTEAFQQLSQRWTLEKDWQLQTPQRIALTPELPLNTACMVLPGSEALHGYVNIRVRGGPAVAASAVADAPLAWPKKIESIPFSVSSAMDVAAAADEPAMSQITVEGYFRGRRVSREIAVNLHAVPEHSQQQPIAPRDGMIALETSPALMNQLASGSGAIAIVLDASGSMGAKQGQPFDEHTRYAQATHALAAVLGSIPRGTQLSVWTLGQAMGDTKTVKDAEKTVTCLRPLSPWDPNDKAARAKLLASLSYPQTEPWNESAVVHAMLAAKKDLASSPGNRTLIAITDGVDNRFASDKEMNPQGLDVAGGLAQNFKNAGIALNIVGFQMASHEEQAARAQFAIIESFTPPGRFYSVSETSALIAALEASLDRRLRYWIEDFDRRAARGGPSDGWTPAVTATPLPQDRASAPRGDYRLRVAAGDVLELPAVVNGGDLLLARVDQAGPQLTIGRGSVLGRLYPQVAPKSAGGWNVAVLKSALHGDTALLEIAVERQADARELQLAMPTPAWCWWECCIPGLPAPVSVAVQRSYETGLPAWIVQSKQSTELPAQVRGSLAGWWLDDTSTLPRTSLMPGRDFEEISSLEGRELSIVGQAAVIRAARWQGDAKRELLLVIDGPPELVIDARLNGVGEVAVEQGHYPSLGRYVGRFEIDAGAISDHAWLELSSIAAMKQLAEAHGTVIRRDDLLLQRAATP